MSKISARAPLVALCQAFLLLACATTLQSHAAGPVPGPAIEHVIRAYVQFHGITGAAIAVQRNDDVLYSGTFGHANVELEAPVRDDTLFQLSSTTKLFTGTLVTSLAQDGLVDLARPLRHYLPQLPETWGDVLVGDALSHVSGVPEVLECEESEDRDRALACVFGMERPMSRRQKFVYNQTNYLLAMMLIESVTGLPFHGALEKYLLMPAGITGAVIDGNSLHVVPGRATSYYPDDSGGIRIREYDFPWFLSTAAGLNLSLADMRRFAAALQDGTLLANEWKARMWQVPELVDGSLSNYSIGWDNRKINHGEESLGHNGGNLTTFRTYPVAGLSVTVLTNGLHSHFDMDELADVLAMTVEPDLLLPVDTLAYHVKLAYIDAGLDASLAMLTEGLHADTLGPDDPVDIVSWFADELADAGRSSDAALVLRYGTERFPAAAELRLQLDEIRETGR